MYLMDFLSLLKKRTNIKAFTDKSVKDSDIKKILEAGRWSPSDHNYQPWSFVVVKNKKTISELMKLCYYGLFHQDPKVIIALVLEPVHMSKKGFYRGRFKKMAEYHKYMSISLPALCMSLKATEMKIGSFILSPTIEEANKILKVSNNRLTCILVGIGYEEKDAFRKPKERIPLKELVSYEKYRARKL